MYTTRNFKTKKAFREAVEAWNRATELHLPHDPQALEARARPVTYYQPGPFGGNEPLNGELFFEGPHYPEPHRWYAQATARDGVVVKVR